MLFHSSREFYPQSSRQSSPHVLSGDRTSRDRETHGVVPGRANPEIPMVKSQPRVTSTRTASLDLSIPRVPKLRCHVSVPPGLHYASRVPLYSFTFGPSRIAESSTPRPCCWKPRMSNPRCPGFVPPVLPGIDGPDQIGGSHFASPTCMGLLHSSTPIRRCEISKGLLCTCGLNPSQLLLRSTTH
jgi:hypothetical protein